MHKRIYIVGLRKLKQQKDGGIILYIVTGQQNRTCIFGIANNLNIKKSIDSDTSHDGLLVEKYQFEICGW